VGENLPLKTDHFIYIPPTHDFNVRKRVLCWTGELNAMNGNKRMGGRVDMRSLEPKEILETFRLHRTLTNGSAQIAW
jgi:hypothetical protein